VEAAGGHNMVITDKKIDSIKENTAFFTINAPQEELNWSSVSLSEVLNRDRRLEASVYDIEGRHAREIINKSKWSNKPLCGDKGFAAAYHRPRFKRAWVAISDLPIYQPSQITELYPKPSGYISEITNTDIDSLRVTRGQILLTCSGTIGKCSIVTATLDNKIFSHDLIRINCYDEGDIGYVYAFLKTKIGNTLVNTNNYGAVISHIEPEHLGEVPVPNPPQMIKRRIHELIMHSFKLRDESNALLDEAEAIMVEELSLPDLNGFKLDYFDPSAGAKNYSVRFSDLSNRFEASFHVPIVNSIISHLQKHSREMVNIGDGRVSKDIILPGRFKRVYVNEGQGPVFLGGKQIHELDPSNKKYLSIKHHKNRIEKELKLSEGMILITCSGTIGKVAIAPKHWEHWTMSQHVIRIVPSSDSITGYIYVFLSSDYGRELINRFTYGSVVDEIDNDHVAQIPIPFIQPDTISQINSLALRANALRYEAYVLEQQAVIVFNQEIFKLT
jgi:type I restriction enzyme, S subunit